jgi:hypothetical protein
MEFKLSKHWTIRITKYWYGFNYWKLKNCWLDDYKKIILFSIGFLHFIIVKGGEN